MFKGRLSSGKADPWQPPFYDIFWVPSCFEALFEFQTAHFKSFLRRVSSIAWLVLLLAFNEPYFTPGRWHEAKCVIWKVSVCLYWVLMSQMEFFANLSPLNTVVSRKVIWLILWYFSHEFDSKVEIVSPFNEPIYLFSGAIPKGENVINVTFPFFWFGFALIVGFISFQFPPWKYWHMALLFSYPKRFHVFGGSSPQWIKTNFL